MGGRREGGGGGVEGGGGAEGVAATRDNSDSALSKQLFLSLGYAGGIYSVLTNSRAHFALRRGTDKKMQ